MFAARPWRLMLLAAAVVSAAAETTCDASAGDGSCAPSPPGDGGSDDGCAMAPAVARLIEDLPTANSLYVDGAWTEPTESASDADDVIAVVDPSTGRKIARVAAASKADVDAAVAAARGALEGWSIYTSLEERRVLVGKLLDAYNERAEEMALLISHEMGAPIDLARSAQVGSGSYHMEQFLHEVGEEGGFEPFYRISEDEDTMMLYQAIGVVGLITPWNWPMNQIALKVIPALLVGCTVVLKPSEQTPLSALLFGELMHDLFPPGVFQLVNGYGPNHVGEWLASHSGVDMVSFTGSTRGGRQVSAAAAPTVKRVGLEMGGKGANIIFEDLVDEDGDMSEFGSVVASGVWGVMGNSGQTCNAPTRMMVPKQHWEYALKVAKETASSVQVGSAHEEGDDHIGPVVSQVQYERIQSYIQSGIDQGATLLVGGIGKPSPTVEAGSGSEQLRRLQRHYQDGFYVRPTVFADCAPNMTIWQEEIFGPVLCMTAFASEDEAIEMANDSPYGLTHRAHTYDKERRLRLAHKLQSGMIVMNDVGLADAAPFGGVKQSGNSREGGVWGLEEFCVVKAVSGIFS